MNPRSSAQFLIRARWAALRAGGGADNGPPTRSGTHAPARRGWRAWALAACFGMALLALLALVPLRDQRVAVQSSTAITTDDATRTPRLYDFYDAERAEGTTYRWTKAWARIVVPDGARLGGALLVRMRLCGCRPVGAQPATQLALNSQPTATLPTSASYRRYLLLVRPPQDMLSNDLYLALRTPVVMVDGRPVGVRFDRLEIVAQPSPALPSPQPLALTLVALAIAAVITYTSRDTLTRWLLLALLLGGPALVLLCYQRQTLTPAALVLAALCGLLFVALARPPRLVALALAALVLALPFAPQLLGGWVVDDAYISFRYAHNLVAGAGLVFNPGERVEGYTNFLWTLVAAAILRLGGDPAQVTPLVTLLIGQAVVVLVWRAGAPCDCQTSRLADGEMGRSFCLSGLVAPLLVATSAPFLLYTARGSGMETALFTLLVLAGLLVIGNWQLGIRNHQSPITNHQLPLSGALLALAAMTRPEGVLVAGVVGLGLLVRAWRCHRMDSAFATESSRKRADVLQQLVLFAAGFLITFGPYYVWRYSYYGLPLPNTFYVKVGASAAQIWRGARYVADYWAAEGLAWAVGLLALFALWVAGRSKRRPNTAGRTHGSPLRAPRRPVSPLVARATAGGRSNAGKIAQVARRLALLRPYRLPAPVSPAHRFTVSPAHLIAAVALVYTLYIVAVGGDWVAGFRFIVPLVPLYALLAQWALRALAARGRWGTLCAAALLALALGDHARHTLATDVSAPNSAVGQENITVMRRREVGRWLRANTPPGTLVAVEAAGALPYYSQRPTLDILGLNDRHIASVDVPTLGLGKPGHEKTDIPYIMDRQPDLIPYFSVPYLKTDPRFKQYVREEHEGPEGHNIILYRRP